MLKRVSLMGGHFDGKLAIVGPGIDRISEFRYEPDLPDALNPDHAGAFIEETYLPVPIDGPDSGLLYFRHVNLAEDDARIFINRLETCSLSDFNRVGSLGDRRTRIQRTAFYAVL